ncbi:murein hydrolase activator EnvC family protein [Magnetococcales bacterium HHB-1]
MVVTSLRFYLFLTLLFMQPIGEVCANDMAKQKSKLQNIIEQLKKENRALEASQNQEQSLLTQLDRLEENVNIARKQKKELLLRIKKTEARLPALKREIAIRQEDLKDRKKKLGAYIRFAYALGDQGILKVIFSQQNSTRFRQSLLYFSHLIQARNENFRRFHLALTNVRREASQEKNLLLDLGNLLKKLEQQEKRLQKRKKERKQLLKRVRVEKKLHKKTVQELQVAQKRLLKFIQRLQTAIKKEKIAPPAKDHATFFGHIRKKRGKLRRPVLGKGRSRPPGIFYPVKKFTPIMAIYKGQVVYADRFRGYGLLVILNHGKQIYSLYAHNQRIFVSQGDWVQEREKIAEAGDSGTLDGVPGLYFEIRHRGKAISPKRWLARR